MTPVDTLVVGAGFAGLSTAYHLVQAGAGPVVVVDREGPTGHRSSANNAGMIRQAVDDAVLARLAREGRDALADADRRGWKIGFEENGSLLLASRRDRPKLAAIERTIAREGLSSKRLEIREASKRVPAIKGGRFDAALWCPSDAFVNIESLARAFRSRLKKANVRVLYGHSVSAVAVKDGRFEVRAGKKTFLARRVVNAAGAWAGAFGRMAGASDVPIKPYRRHLFLAVSPRPSAKWPFVWDLSNEFYFRPLAGRLLLSPCDKTLLDPQRRGRFQTDPAMKRELARKLRRFGGSLASARIGSPRAGLRTMAPDGRFVIGEDLKLVNFFWVAGLGGHGVTTAFAVGRLAAAQMTGRPVERALAAAVSLARFSKKQAAHAA